MVPRPHPARRAGHVIMDDARGVVLLVRGPGQLPGRPQPGPVPDPPGRGPVRPRPAHRHQLAAAAGIADDFRPAYSLLWTIGRRTAWMAARLLALGAAAAGGRAVASVVRPGRHADGALRPVRAGGGRPPQPDAGAGRAEVRLRPRLGDAGLAGAPPVVGEHRPAAAGEPVRPPPRRAQAAARVPVALPHQTGVGRGVAALAGGVAEALGRAAVAGRGRGLRLPRGAAGPPVGTR